MEKHVTIVAILHIIGGVLLFLIGTILFLILSGAGLISREPIAIFVTSTIGTILAIIFTLLSLPSIIGGIGLMQYKNWARILLLFVAVINLLNFPIGTIIGLYTLWVLLQDRTIRLFEQNG